MSHRITAGAIATAVHTYLVACSPNGRKRLLAVLDLGEDLIDYEVVRVGNGVPSSVGMFLRLGDAVAVYNSIEEGE